MQKIQIRPPKGQPLCSDEKKARIVAEIRHRHEWGEGSIEQLAGEFGISATSYVNWLKQFPPTPVVRPVTIVPAPPVQTSGGGILISPQGYRVEGLSVAE